MNGFRIPQVKGIGNNVLLVFAVIALYFLRAWSEDKLHSVDDLKGVVNVLIPAIGGQIMGWLGQESPCRKNTATATVTVDLPEVKPGDPTPSTIDTKQS